jgi:hypothetical protein
MAGGADNRDSGGGGERPQQDTSRGESGGSGGTGGGGGGGGGGSCAHSDCSTGAKLTSGCNSCVTQICSQDSYCCNTLWDSICVGEVGSICGQTCN